MSATPRPWYTTKLDNWNYIHAHKDKVSPSVIAIVETYGDEEANAELIVRAVNSHDALLEALKKIRSYATKEVNSGAADYYVKEMVNLRFICDEAIQQAKAKS